MQSLHKTQNLLTAAANLMRRRGLTTTSSGSLTVFVDAGVLQESVLSLEMHLKGERRRAH